MNQVNEGREDRSALECIHVKVERKMFDENTGERISEPMIKVHSLSAWGVDTAHGMQDYYRRYGYEYEVMFDPRQKKAEIKSENAIEPEVEPEPQRRGRKPKGE